MNDLELVELIIKTCEEHNITAYEIGKNTHVSTFAVQRILKRETKKPYRGTLLEIYQYLESNLVGTDLPIIEEKLNMVSEPSNGFGSQSSELLNSYKKQIYLFEKNMDLYEENADLHREASNLLREKIHYLEEKLNLN